LGVVATMTKPKIGEKKMEKNSQPTAERPRSLA